MEDYEDVYEQHFNSDRREMFIEFSFKKAKEILSPEDFSELNRIMSILKDRQGEIFQERKKRFKDLPDLNSLLPEEPPNLDELFDMIDASEVSASKPVT